MTKLVLVVTSLFMLVGMYTIDANQEYFAVEADGADAAIFTYAVAASYSDCYGDVEFLPTTGNYETALRHEWEAEPGQWLCLHLETASGYEEIKVRKIERLYHVFLPVVVGR